MFWGTSGDPAEGRAKDCFCTPGFKRCSKEWEYCQCNGVVLFGVVQGLVWNKREVDEGITCQASEFDDYEHEGHKECFCQGRPSDSKVKEAEAEVEDAKAQGSAADKKLKLLEDRKKKKYRLRGRSSETAKAHRG
eukprot:TRINITY_DN1902_c0_g1_i1.p2 TRINITY_DN1902_c0_g1~~TRINITY_DN1902_c0_g1_i1.p2  ORF type:complete len:135 (+),score=49.74 TRINITY_DN1902_c0_g1_i1:34-438(+)